ncbi:MAG: hypothetical protein HYT40_01870 [Candidatus Sungbacteria bacterium]|uniref:Uncharacterized protein n=1 Tax=Candidatus Sungiibacteriota bacterium TaxID=2750080 RepID=A0A931WPK5_9BACT|nr:hypothetical protein [Candidatus Sungbacteria bacterium]
MYLNLCNKSWPAPISPGRAMALLEALQLAHLPLLDERKKRPPPLALIIKTEVMQGKVQYGIGCQAEFAACKFPPGFAVSYELPLHMREEKPTVLEIPELMGLLVYRGFSTEETLGYIETAWSVILLVEESRNQHRKFVLDT